MTGKYPNVSLFFNMRKMFLTGYEKGSVVIIPGNAYIAGGQIYNNMWGCSLNELVV